MTSDPVDGLDWYLVGGAVRDWIMGREPTDFDAVVVGSTPEEMKDRGFNRVGESFPVFLHPENNMEFALARREFKNGEGYSGFDWETEDVSLEEDLKRRDFTCNAMALNPRTLELIDPFDGQTDIRNSLLRHVSSHFEEDPLRVLRMARFATRLTFNIHPHTKKIAQSLAPRLENVANERYGEEILKACKQSSNITRYFRLLKRIGALDIVAPTLSGLEDVPAGFQRGVHQEGDTFTHTMMVLREMEYHHPNQAHLYLMALSHDLGKFYTGMMQDNHAGHAQAGSIYASLWANHLRLSNRYKRDMMNAALYHTRILSIPEMKAGKTVRFVKRLDDCSTNLLDLLSVIEADSFGRTPPKSFDVDELLTHIQTAKDAIDEWPGQRLKDEGYEGTGKAFGQTLLNRRAHRYKELINGQD